MSKKSPYEILGLPLSRFENDVLGLLKYEACHKPFDHLKGRFLIACTSRSGSTLLSAALERYDFSFGEYLLLSEFVINAKSEFGIKSTNDLAILLASKMAPKGRLSIKVAYPDLPLLFLFDEFPDNLSKWKIVYLKRHNLVAQAISGRIAEMTGQWTSENRARQRVSSDDYNFDAILNILEAYANENRLWDRLFNIFSIEPLRVTFEDLVADVASTAAQVADFCAVDIAQYPKAEQHKPWPRKQGTELNQIWEDRFRADAVKFGKIEVAILGSNNTAR